MLHYTWAHLTLPKQREESEYDKETLKLVSDRSRFVVESQLESIRSKQSFSGTIIGVVSLFTPFFLNFIQDASYYFKFLALIPLAMLVLVLVLMLLVLTAKPIGRTMQPNKFEEMIERHENDALLYDIAYHKQAYMNNIGVYNTISNRYLISVWLTIGAVIFSTFILFIDRVTTDKTGHIQKIEIVNPNVQKHE